MIILLTISISSTCFRRQFRPSSGALDCVYSLWYKAPMMLPAGSISVHHQESSTVHIAIGICHSEISKMGKITSVYTCTWRIWHSEDRASWHILIINQWDALISQIYFFTYTSNFTHFLNFSMTCTIAVCSALDSWWWTEIMSETCRVLFQKLIRETDASSWFYYKNYLMSVYRHVSFYFDSNMIWLNVRQDTVFCVAYSEAGYLEIFSWFSSLSARKYRGGTST